MTAKTSPFASTRLRGLTYAQSRAILERGSAQQRLALAQSDEAPPEALYFLAEHGAEAVRRAVAGNPRTPHQADQLLVNDPMEEVRGELARKIGRMLPNLGEADRVRLREQAIVIIEALAQDQAPRVRAILVEEIKSSPLVPHHVARRLAEDPELLVCGPILEYSPLLSDVDLNEIIAAGRAKDALDSISRRQPLSADVCAAIGRTGHTAAVAALLANANAQIREDTLDLILDQAPANPSWHEPLVLRSNLSVRAMRRIAGFVAAALVDKMLAAHVVEEPLAQELLLTVRRRIESEPADLTDQEQAEADAREVLENGWFDDQWVLDRLAQGERMLVTAALGLASGLGVTAARKVLGSRQGRVVMALSWKAGLTARTGYELQQQLAHVAATALVTPRGGLHYPATPSEMEWAIEAFV